MYNDVGGGQDLMIVNAGVLMHDRSGDRSMVPLRLAGAPFRPETGSVLRPSSFV